MIHFQSSAAADISMFDEPARELLRMAGRLDADRGAIGADEVAAALQALRQALAALPAVAPDEHDTSRDQPGEDDGQAQDQSVSLQLRAFPLIEMLERAAAKGVAVLWERH